MPTMHCTEPVCRHQWSEAREPNQPRCPRCGGFWVRVSPAHRTAALRRPAARSLALR